MIVRSLTTLALSMALIFAVVAPAHAGEFDDSDPRSQVASEEVLVDVVYARAWVSNGQLFVAGEIRNTSGHRLDGWAQVAVAPGHYTSGTTVLASVAGQALARGSRLPFFGTQSPFAPKSVSVTWSNAGGWLVGDPVSAIGVSYAGGLYSDPAGTGDSARYQIRNTTDRSIWVMPVAVFRGSDGKVSNMVLGSAVDMLPGEIVEDVLLAPPTGRLAVSVSMDIRAAGFTEAPYAPIVSWSNWFEDVDGQSLKGAIAWLAEQGITGGCSRFRYCPTASVTRAQMAMFLVRAFALPPATGPDHFVDDDGVTGESSINALYEAGITAGCAPSRFCPTASVTRAQMALFIDRAVEPPLSATSTDFFDDDDGKTGEAAINRLAAAGITGGCGPRRFCPNDRVTRAQMAAFLQRALTYMP
jgi:hypothetical protein